MRPLNIFKADGFISLVIIVNMAFLVGCGGKQKAKESTGPETLLKNVSAEELPEIIHAFKDKKALLINVWATWCGPCVEEFPHIVDLQKKYKDKLQVIFISADFKEDRQRALEFLKKHEVQFTTYFKISKDAEFISALSDEWSGALPFTKLVARDGEVVDQWENKADYETFEEKILTTINHN